MRPTSASTASKPNKQPVSVWNPSPDAVPFEMPPAVPGGILRPSGPLWQCELKPPDQSLVSARRIESSGFHLRNDTLRTVHALSAGTARRSTYRIRRFMWCWCVSPAYTTVPEVMGFLIKRQAIPLQKFDIFLIDFFVPIVYDKIAKYGKARRENPRKATRFWQNPL